MQTGKETQIVLTSWKRENTNTNGWSNLQRGKGHVCHCQLSSQWRFTEDIVPLFISSSPQYSIKRFPEILKYKHGNVNTKQPFAISQCQLSSQWRFREALLPLSSSPRYSNKMRKKVSTNTKMEIQKKWQLQLFIVN